MSSTPLLILRLAAVRSINIMENIGKEPSLVHGTIHGPGYSGKAGISSSYSLSGGKVLADDFHVYAVEWVPGSLSAGRVIPTQAPLFRKLL